MADILSKGSLFPEELIPDFIKKTTGASALAKLCSATPIPFNGVKEFTFSLDKEVDIVAENGAKTKGGLTVDPITIVPIRSSTVPASRTNFSTPPRMRSWTT